MKLGRVVGRVWSTAKHESLESLKILLVRPTDPRGGAAGEAYLALDSIGAGAGEHVLVLDEGGGAGIVLGQDDPPIRTVVVGIVDEIHLGSGAA